MEGVIEGIESGYADLGFAIAPPPRPNVTMEPLVTDDMVVVMPVGHPLATYNRLGPRELVGQTIIGLEQTSRLGSIVREQFAKTGSPYMPRVEVRHCTTACTLVERGLGISVVDPFSVHAQNRWQIAVRVFEPAISVSANVLYLTERPLSRLAARFINYVKESTADKANRP
jgi:DNA-binding transcriptional LysR family regulator